MKTMMIQIDADYKPDEIEERTIFGVRLQQKRNQAIIDKSFLTNVVSENKEVSHNVSQPHQIFIIIALLRCRLPQKRNQAIIDKSILTNVVSENKELSHDVSKRHQIFIILAL